MDEQYILNDARLDRPCWWELLDDQILYLNTILGPVAIGVAALDSELVCVSCQRPWMVEEDALKRVSNNDPEGFLNELQDNHDSLQIVWKRQRDLYSYQLDVFAYCPIADEALKISGRACLQKFFRELDALLFDLYHALDPEGLSRAQMVGKYLEGRQLEYELSYCFGDWICTLPKGCTGLTGVVSEPYMDQISIHLEGPELVKIVCSVKVKFQTKYRSELLEYVNRRNSGGVFGLYIREHPFREELELIICGGTRVPDQESEAGLQLDWILDAFGRLLSRYLIPEVESLWKEYGCTEEHFMKHKWSMFADLFADNPDDADDE